MTTNSHPASLPSPSLREQRKGMIHLHLSVFLAGFTGLFGKLITLNEVDIVWYRMMLTTMILLVFTSIPWLGLRKTLQVAGCGTLLGIHWILFYASIKASNVSIGVVCFATVGFFTALLEPLLHHHRVSLPNWLCRSSPWPASPAFSPSTPATVWASASVWCPR